jgi:hypothetical protein
MSTLPARVDLNGQQLYPAIEICDLADLPYDHYHQTVPITRKDKGRAERVLVRTEDHTFCAWCFHWTGTDGLVLPRAMDNCHCDQGCHIEARELDEAS